MGATKSLAYSQCPCADCYQARRAACDHTSVHTDEYGYSECRDCGADHESPLNPLTRCHMGCTFSSYGLCQCDGTR